jgi:hypothetical protein
VEMSVGWCEFGLKELKSKIVMKLPINGGSPLAPSKMDIEKEDVKL